MKGLSVEVMNGLTEFLLAEVVEKVLYGISYSLVMKNESNKATIDKYLKLRDKLNKEGVSTKEVFRVYEVSNGYIFDLELNEAIWLTQLISNDVAKNNGGETPVGDLNIREKSIERHRADLDRLKNKIVRAARDNIGCIEVALFSKNRSNNVVITGEDANDKKVNLAVKYDAFAIRHTDMNELNREYLMPLGLMVTAVKVHEILPSSTGVRFKINISKTGR